MKTPRVPGQTIQSQRNTLWLVITESKFEEGEWHHTSCKSPLSRAIVNIEKFSGDEPSKSMGFYTEDIPYCPRCENRPTGGKLLGKRLIIY